MCVHRGRKGAIALVGALTLVTIGCTAARSGEAAPRQMGPYLSDGAHSEQLIPLDPATLADRTDRAGVHLDSPAWAVSSDGSTLVSLAYARDPGRGGLSPDEVTVVVRDTRTGNERSRFHPPADVVGPELNRDGTRLLAQARVDTWSQSVEWWVLNTSGGEVLGRVELNGPGWHTQIFDADARRMYVLQARASSRALSDRPSPAFLSVRDVWTGAELAQVDLPNVLAGPWQSARNVGGTKTPALLAPTLALIPDGSRLAVVHAEADAITMVETDGFRVERTVAISHSAGAATVILESLGLAPGVADAKGFDGTIRQAVFAPDGQHLNVWTLNGRFADDGRPRYRGRGLALFDTAHGVIAASAIPDTQIEVVRPSPDGRVTYVLGPASDDNVDMGRSNFLLRSLEASPLRMQAERGFQGYRGLALIQEPGDASESERP